MTTKTAGTLYAERYGADDAAYEAAIGYAESEGRCDGHAAASWYELGDATAARIVLDGINDGDPEVLDTLPHTDLSGEWADSRTGPMLVAEAYSVDMDDITESMMDAFSDICDAYETAYDTAVSDAITARCASLLA